MMHTRQSVYLLGGVAIILLALFLLLAFVVGGGIFHQTISIIDLTVGNALEASGTAAHILLFFTYLANPEVIILLQAALLVFVVMMRRRVLAAFFVGGMLAGEILSSFFKIILARARPLSAFEFLTHTYAFPSGHAVAATVFYGFIGFCLIHVLKRPSQKWLAAFSAILVIGLIGISRIALGFHWASDVVGGWLLGGVVLCVLIIAFEHLHVHVTWGKLEPPHGQKLALIVAIALIVSFAIFTFYVTHPLKIRSTIESGLKA